MIDEDAFRHIYDNHVDLVFNLCLQYLQNTEDAEEAAQDVFVKIHKNWSSFRNESSQKTWIYRITINQCLDIIKSRKRKKRFAFLMSLSQQESTHHQLSGFDHPGVELENKEALEFIFSCINKLPDKQKTALILKSIERLSQKEIAAIMRTSEKAIESLLSRARANLVKLLNDNEGNT